MSDDRSSASEQATSPVSAFQDSYPSELSIPSASSSGSLKRRASPSFQDQDDNSRKRMKEDSSQEDVASAESSSANEDSISENLADTLAQELQCGCCSELVYRPVLVSPCQHFFCGSCCILWIKNGGTNCPACRGVSNIVTPFRALQGVIDALLRAAPHKARTERERQQADEIYRAGSSLRLPVPRAASPEPDINQATDYARPCPHCPPGNDFGWRCPQPIADPHTDPEHAWSLEDGLPPGHGYCGNCGNLLALQAPTTSKCDLCQVSFCGIGVHNRCVAAHLVSQQPHDLTQLVDLVQSTEVYECFESNTVEVDIMLDYLTAQQITPVHIYREIIAYVQAQPDGFKPLIESELFVDTHGGNIPPRPVPDAPRSRICRVCAAEVLLWGLKGWWVRERQKGFLEEHVMNRKDCPQGSRCPEQKDLAHAKEFNHIIASPGANPVASAEAPSDDISAQQRASETSSRSTTPSAGETVVPSPIIALGEDVEMSNLS